MAITINPSITSLTGALYDPIVIEYIPLFTTSLKSFEGLITAKDTDSQFHVFAHLYAELTFVDGIIK